MTSSADLDTLVQRLRAAGCVFAEEEADVLLASAGDGAELERMVAARVTGVPLEHVVGWASFAGVRVPVRPGVFVPRRRTEHLLAVAVGLTRPGELVVDLCCGSGAIALALHAAVPDLRLHASDLQPEAVACASDTLAGIAAVHAGDLFDALPAELRGRVDVVVANVPYVPTAAVPLLPRDAREHVAPMTVDGGADGLAVLRRVAAEARNWLAPGGRLLSEVAEDQVPAALTVLETSGLRARVCQDEELDASVVVGRSG
ncbi:putative protein N(5)-glutamine methyltransferase [Desertihabitans aurantiacus]|uniref:putative protein N(5)-glutamine methyltransferase n=1 Tax=Desertihabitans aurantiacus TaxID=2282477 RepID=UPI000DF79096|nr:putative protein N(5)-glutamine methyltransferase [Desertihabitans aurantiacus]